MSTYRRYTIITKLLSSPSTTRRDRTSSFYVIELVGNETIVLNETDILSLPTHTGSGSFITSVGSIRGPDNYTGVLITDLLAL